MRSPTGELGGYLYRVALNHLRNHRRKDRTALSVPRGSMIFGNPKTTPTGNGSGGPNGRAAVRSVLEELPGERDRELLVRFYLHDEAKEQICEELRVSPGRTSIA